MRLIDADEFRNQASRVYPEYWEDVLDETPTVDAVEVVRCKDCKYFDTSDVSGTIPPIVYRCKRFARTYREAEDFCSYAERKETENGVR